MDLETPGADLETPGVELETPGVDRETTGVKDLLGRPNGDFGARRPGDPCTGLQEVLTDVTSKVGKNLTEQGRRQSTEGRRAPRGNIRCIWYYNAHPVH